MKYQRNPQTNLQIRIIKKKSLRGRKDFQCRYVYQYLEELKKSHPAVPSLIVEGHSSDNKFSKKTPILEYLPNGKLKIIEDCGHMMNMERPEEFNAALEEFLINIEQ